MKLCPFFFGNLTQNLSIPLHDSSGERPSPCFSQSCRRLSAQCSLSLTKWYCVNTPATDFGTMSHLYPDFSSHCSSEMILRKNQTSPEKQTVVKCVLKNDFFFFFFFPMPVVEWLLIKGSNVLYGFITNVAGDRWKKKKSTRWTR